MYSNLIDWEDLRDFVSWIVHTYTHTWTMHNFESIRAFLPGIFIALRPPHRKSAWNPKTLR